MTIGILVDEMPEENRNRREDRWHLGKDVPLALILTLIGQAVVIIWSIAGLYNKVDTLTVAFNKLELERYTKEDGRRDRELTALINEGQRQRDIEQDRRITILESIINQLRTPK